MKTLEKSTPVQVTNVLLDVHPGDRLVDKIRALSPRLNITENASPAALREAHVVYTNSPAFDVDDAPNLRWVQVNTAAINHLANCPLAGSDIPIANVRGAYSCDVAELTIGLLLTLTRKLHVFHDLQSRQQWPAVEPAGDSCYGKTMGIIGYGSIGRHIARIAQNMGMKVLACKRDPEDRRDDGYCRPSVGDPGGVIPARWFGMDQLHGMLRQSDVAICTLPLTPATLGIIGATELAALPRGAYFINIGRGKVVDEAALVESLRSNHLAGAGLDVMATEPLDAASGLWKTPNLVITPHIASWTHRQTELAADVLMENLRRDLAGEPLVNLVDITAGY